MGKKVKTGEMERMYVDRRGRGRENTRRSNYDLIFSEEN